MSAYSRQRYKNTHLLAARSVVVRTPTGLTGPTRRTVLGPLAIENAAGRSVPPARTPFDPASDFYRPSGSSVREGLKGGQVLITDVTYNKDHSPGVVGLPTASREWRRQLAVVPCRDTKPACGRTNPYIPIYHGVLYRTLSLRL